MEDLQSGIPTIEECEEILRNAGMPDEYFNCLNGNKNPEKVDVL